ncbi:MAG: tRNA pseudouridine(38-40) synthase TruA [Acidobacteriota bacterium]|nr:MAG: tRNA pseudouridine(38-40) synthase TruA [Acidobacteriota bacterium]
MAAEKGKTFRAVLAYDGTSHHGWQRQKDTPTIQGAFEDALFEITRRHVAVVAAGRTDAGVHARGQAVSFALPHARLGAGALQRALNALLPPSIRVKCLSPAPKNFHARRDAKRKRYAYRIYDGPVMPPLERLYALHSPGRIDCATMREALRRLVGKHDFAAFRAAGSSTKTSVRTLYRASLTRRGHRITMRFEADGFLRHMVRNIVGTLLMAGRGELAPEDMTEILRSKDRGRAGPTAPPEGLVLEKVTFE